ncbi:hypothetical protein PTTG_09198 [Puccinia triticina 1-1 BBBD Race 1]|uniref:Uncharacterized protein n=2 Tax=Puccinia triticina TaxID=208348 RepID=A0A0C4F7R4_PUCT1|nr:uncharacterized protein PtA15_2A896 [Puccinia triticina]OAV98728.1 hypothetical protein PTTG_09198 [Puccinia triticina 1-1 BBBD Race 1]WAQ82579.1 hypothetical protein PtA15_2A896 [Puccinia triticina]
MSAEAGELCSSSEELTLLLLSDSSLPVGGFVSSSGLESFTNHGFLAHCKTDLARSHALVKFTFSNAQSYASLCGAFFYHLHTLVTDTLKPNAEDQDRLDPSQASAAQEEEEQRLQQIARIVHKLNQLFDSMCLSPVNRRNSYAQGAAFLLLYSKSFGPPAGPSSGTGLERLKSRLIDSLKREIRRGNGSIHYPISFAFVTGLLGLSFDRAIHLHIFLHIRSILSAAVRLNIIGPYLSQKIMFTNMKSMLDSISGEIDGKRLARSDLVECGLLDPGQPESVADRVEDGPATTWPFGEIIQTRHDSCHVRLFNS